MHLRNGSEEIAHDTWSVEPFVAAARAAGVDEIGFTEHVYYFRQTRSLWTVPYQTERCVYDLEPYVDAIVQARERGLPVKLGLEVDYVPGREDETRELLTPYPWVYLLGSVHFIDGLGVDGEPRLLDAVGVEEAWTRYFDTLAAAAGSGLFDSLSHSDLVKIFGARASSFDYAPVAAAIAASGVAVEVSTRRTTEAGGRPVSASGIPRSLSRARGAGHARLGRALARRRRPRLRPRARADALRGLRDGHDLRATPGAAGADRMSDLRVGIGVDAHAFADGVPLVLGGVSFDSARGLAGHSDGDVITHALIDAVLGAAGLGDIGSLFPSDSSTPAGVSSLDLLDDALVQVREAGYSVVNADCVLIGEEPRIASRRAEMAELLTARVGAPVNVRATTTDRLGFTGRGEGLAAQVVALVDRS